MTFKEIQERFTAGNLQLNWHQDYQWEEWIDGIGPLTLTDVKKLGGLFYVEYSCSRENCLRCKQSWFKHHKLLKENGDDLFGKGVEEKRGKRDVMVLKDQPVFKE